MSGVLGVRSYSGLTASLKSSEGQVRGGDLHVSYDDEGVVRVTNLGDDDAVLIIKAALEELLTEVYAKGLLDRKRSQDSRL